MYSWRIISKKTPKTKPYTSGNTYSNRKYQNQSYHHHSYQKHKMQMANHPENSMHIEDQPMEW
jgi:Zn-finger nucleic acid-binding protein